MVDATTQHVAPSVGGITCSDVSCVTSSIGLIPVEDGQTLTLRYVVEEFVVL